MRRAIVLFLFATAAFADTRIVDLGNRKVRVRTEGAAGPSVVFEAGFRSTLDSWNPVIPDVAKFARVFAYDRAGLGQSDPATSERSYVALANELHEIVDHEKVQRPFVFVGHSYGGALARVYTKLYPADVSGVVFIDPMSELFIANDTEREKHLAQQETSLLNAPPGPVAEWAYLRKETAAGYAELQKYGNPNVPMALVIANVNHVDAWRTSLMQTYGSWILSREDSLLVVTPNSTHIVMNDQPQLVVDAIRALVHPNPIASLYRACPNGAGAVIAAFRDEQQKYDPSEITPRLLNTIGYNFLREEKTGDAVKVFAQNVAAFPADANAYDSLGEAYAASGDKARALENYRKSLELDPKNDNARRVIKQLESK